MLGTGASVPGIPTTLWDSLAVLGKGLEGKAAGPQSHAEGSYWVVLSHLCCQPCTRLPRGKADRNQAHVGALSHSRRKAGICLGKGFLNSSQDAAQRMQPGLRVRVSGCCMPKQRSWAGIQPRGFLGPVLWAAVSQSCTQQRLESQVSMLEAPGFGAEVPQSCLTATRSQMLRCRRGTRLNVRRLQMLPSGLPSSIMSQDGERG